MIKASKFTTFAAMSAATLALLACADLATGAASAERACETEVAGEEDDILTVKGARYKILDGGLYSCKKGKWKYEYSLEAGFAKRYEIRKTGNSCVLVHRKSGKKQPLARKFSSSFEEAGFRELFTTGGWSSTGLLSPRADTVQKYSELHRELMHGGKFRDNRMDLDKELVRSGKRSLRFHAVKPGANTQNVSKAMIENRDLCFGKGDHIWFSAWFYIEQGMPGTLFDFEASRFRGGPGIRLLVQRRKYASMELKFADKRRYEQFTTELPRKRWFNLKLHLLLSNKEDGLVELWQDGVKIVSEKGQTLPTHDTIYNRMQIGITATPRLTTMLVDDVALSSEPL